MKKMHNGLHGEYPLFLLDFKETFIHYFVFTLVLVELNIHSSFP